MNGHTVEFGLLQMSAIHEMANIGLGHATTALSELTGHSFNMSIPSVSSVAVTAVPELLGGPEAITLCVYMPFAGDVSGHTAFITTWTSGKTLLDLLLGSSPCDVSGIGELEASALLEVGNIINSSFLNALSDMTDLALHATPPMVSVEMAGAILESLAAEAEQQDCVALSVQTRIFDLTGSAEGYFMCVPTLEGLHMFFDRLGIAEAA